MPTEQEQNWIDAWRYAGPRLEQIRRDELRSLDESAGARLLGAGVQRPANTPSSGLATFQAWMMRLRVLELMRERDRS